eukprot:3846033-Amphidinium_carterae.1
MDSLVANMLGIEDDDDEDLGLHQDPNLINCPSKRYKSRKQQAWGMCCKRRSLQRVALCRNSQRFEREGKWPKRSVKWT